MEVLMVMWMRMMTTRTRVWCASVLQHTGKPELTCATAVLAAWFLAFGGHKTGQPFGFEKFFRTFFGKFFFFLGTPMGIARAMGTAAPGMACK